MFIRLFAVVASVTISASVLARPVSYPDGTTVMLRNDGRINSLHLHYSPTARYSIGYRGEYGRDQGWNFHGAQFNYLIKRRNARAAQANAYFKSGAGVYRRGSSELGGFVGFAADWETRRLFVSYENRWIDAPNIESTFFQRARFGVAPYIGDYGALHTWLMVQLNHDPELDRSFSVTPMVRFFKGATLGELGINNDGEVMFNFVVRY